MRTCENCAAQCSLPPKAPLHSWPWANRPMQRIHIDYAEIEGYQVLVIIDIHSKWIEAIPLRTATAATSIEAIRRFFASFGLPEEIISDNGPQFVAIKFVTFCKMALRISTYHLTTLPQMGLQSEQCKWSNKQPRKWELYCH